MCGTGVSTMATASWVLIGIAQASVALADMGSGSPPVTGFAPGAVFREYHWNGPWVNAIVWQRVTDPGATYPGAKEFLPNPVNSVEINDIDGAVYAEVCIELLQCHAGTTDKRIRLNGGEWLSIPEAINIPGGKPHRYQTMTYPVVEVPLHCLRSGTNTFELTAGDSGWGWGQFLIYGVTFRVYYAATIAHPTGQVTFPTEGTTLTENPTITAEASSPAGVKRVDFLAFYEDFNFRGDNVWRQWQYVYRYGEMQHHVGTATHSPFRVMWNTEWVPDQDKPMKLMARITDNNGVSFLTPAVDNVALERTGRSVKLCKPYDVPERWVSRGGNTHRCKVNITEDLERATAARLLLVTWDGKLTDAIGINERKLVKNIGGNHDLSFDEIPVPLEYLKPGVNEPYTYSATEHHGIEVNWPGIGLKVAFESK